MHRQKPPFRADHVGSLLRPQSLKEARAKKERGEITRDQLHEVEDRAIDQIIRRQEEVGLQSITDGEFRRHAWQTDFLANLDGTEEGVGRLPMPDGQVGTFRVARVTGKVGFSQHPMLEHFNYVKAHTRGVAKMTIPSPTMMISVMRDWRDVISPAAYTELPPLIADLGRAYQGAIKAFYDAGCRYLQLDDCNLAFLCDPARQDALRQRGEDPDLFLRRFVALINDAVKGKFDDMTITMHLCRGNLRSTWMSQGGYEPVAELLLGGIDIDGFFLEYDNERAGGFEPLRFLPKGRKNLVVLGLVTTKSGVLESKDALKRRVDEAAKQVDIDRLCLSPQCGFASTEEGNLLSDEDQWRKLALVRQVADDIWG